MIVLDVRDDPIICLEFARHCSLQLGVADNEVDVRLCGGLDGLGSAERDRSGGPFWEVLVEYRDDAATAIGSRRDLVDDAGDDLLLVTGKVNLAFVYPCRVGDLVRKHPVGQPQRLGEERVEVRLALDHTSGELENDLLPPVVRIVNSPVLFVHFAETCDSGKGRVELWRDEHRMNGFAVDVQRSADVANDRDDTREADL